MSIRPLQFLLPLVLISLLAGCATAEQRPSPDATENDEPSNATALSGTWDGSYVCAEGRIGLTLTLIGQPDGGVSGTFAFLPRNNPSLPSGSYRLSGTHTADGRVTLTPGEWIDRPTDYFAFGLAGRAAPGGNRLHGQILSPACSGFEVTRRM